MRSPVRLLPLFLLAASLASCDRREEAAAALPAGNKEEATDSLYGAPASRIVQVVPVEIEVPGLPGGWEGMRIAALSDFHLGLWEDNERVARAAVERAVAANPDLVVLLGDYVARGDDYAALERVVAPLRGHTALAVLGTEDEAEDTGGEPDSARIRTVQALETAGVTVLQNGRAPVVRGGDTAYVAGVDPYLPRKPDWRQAEIFAAIPGAPTTPVLLSHMPAVAVRVPDGKFPAILTGHTFCGDVEVPGTPRLSWVNTTLFPGVSTGPGARIFRIHGSTLFVTCGVGYSFVPVRLGAPPEVAMVTLRSVGAPRAPADTAAAPRDTTQARADSILRAYQRGDTARRDSGGT